MPSALGIVKTYFPAVEKVVDGTKKITVTVTKEDNRKATKKNHSSCVLANCVKTQEEATGVIVGIRTVYVVKGNLAFRYHTLETTSREIVSFDREAGFEPGEYTLIPVTKTQRFGETNGRKEPSGKRTGEVKSNRKHFTTNVRTSLAGGA